MRRERLLPESEARQILKKGQYGVMSAVSPDGTPYGVPLNYYYDENENALFFHCATRGHKLDSISHHSCVSFTVVTRSEIDAPNLTTLYESAIVTGHASFVRSDEEKMQRLEGLCRTLTPSVSADTCSSLPHTAVVRISIETITGKRNDS
jgi:nitroimidazol reductase NimA-like FMN-containing flavoprotein (pyridoxamine 5'-phosphate oxidase superfamily)